MKNIKIKRNIWAIVFIFLLFISFLLCRYVFFDLHQMKQFPFVLFLLGLSIIIVASIFNKSKLAICTVLGYNVGVTMGLLFGVDWTDSHGTKMNSTWIWFVVVMLFFICIGVIWEVISKKIKFKV